MAQTGEHAPQSFTGFDRLADRAVAWLAERRRVAREREAARRAENPPPLYPRDRWEAMAPEARAELWAVRDMAMDAALGSPSIMTYGAAAARLGNAERFAAMSRRGAGDAAIRRVTRYERGPFGYGVETAGDATLRPAAVFGAVREGSLGDLAYIHPEVARAYPTMGDVKVEMVPSAEWADRLAAARTTSAEAGGAGSTGAYAKATDTILVKGPSETEPLHMFADRADRTLVHEMQHAAQARDGLLGKTAGDYRTAAKEVDARNSANRRWLGPAERREMPREATQDVGPKEVHMDDKGGEDINGRHGNFTNFLATDDVPESIFGIPVVQDEGGYTEKDIEFFKENPKAAGFYEMGDEEEDDGTQEAFNAGIHGDEEELALVTPAEEAPPDPNPPPVVLDVVGVGEPAAPPARDIYDEFAERSLDVTYASKEDREDVRRRTAAEFRRLGQMFDRVPVNEINTFLEGLLGYYQGSRSNPASRAEAAANAYTGSGTLASNRAPYYYKGETGNLADMGIVELPKPGGGTILYAHPFTPWHEYFEDTSPYVDGADRPRDVFLGAFEDGRLSAGDYAKARDMYEKANSIFDTSETGPDPERARRLKEGIEYVRNLLAYVNSPLARHGKAADYLYPTRRRSDGLYGYENAEPSVSPASRILHGGRDMGLGAADFITGITGWKTPERWSTSAVGSPREILHSAGGSDFGTGASFFTSTLEKADRVRDYVNTWGYGFGMDQLPPRLRDVIAFDPHFRSYRRMLEDIGVDSANNWYDFYSASGRRDADSRALAQLKAFSEALTPEELAGYIGSHGDTNGLVLLQSKDDALKWNKAHPGSEFRMAEEDIWGYPNGEARVKEQAKSADDIDRFLSRLLDKNPTPDIPPPAIVDRPDSPIRPYDMYSRAYGADASRVVEDIARARGAETGVNNLSELLVGIPNATLWKRFFEDGQAPERGTVSESRVKTPFDEVSVSTRSTGETGRSFMTMPTVDSPARVTLTDRQLAEGMNNEVTRHETGHVVSPTHLADRLYDLTAPIDRGAGGAVYNYHWDSPAEFAAAYTSFKQGLRKAGGRILSDAASFDRALEDYFPEFVAAPPAVDTDAEWIVEPDVDKPSRAPYDAETIPYVDAEGHMGYRKPESPRELREYISGMLTPDLRKSRPEEYEFYERYLTALDDYDDRATAYEDAKRVAEARQLSARTHIPMYLEGRLRDRAKELGLGLDAEDLVTGYFMLRNLDPVKTREWLDDAMRKHGVSDEDRERALKAFGTPEQRKEKFRQLREVLESPGFLEQLGKSATPHRRSARRKDIV